MKILGVASRSFSVFLGSFSPVSAVSFVLCRIVWLSSLSFACPLTHESNKPLARMCTSPTHRYFFLSLLRGQTYLLTLPAPNPRLRHSRRISNEHCSSWTMTPMPPLGFRVRWNARRNPPSEPVPSLCSRIVSWSVPLILIFLVACTYHTRPPPPANYSLISHPVSSCLHIHISTLFIPPHINILSTYLPPCLLRRFFSFLNS
ncbi:hypothetical protein M413DRAFT_282893 [Hebeloma cylindrosporum]|uniref:Uncharacterized protein n=1 Tax=Hebeloma cylindrosporum TaxID=76867 RepID=A0A0C3BZU1_HEBCY|nr:hypothetical protein M413DRAFT_282893 [Hebeloma cylindrosporum h7]